MSLMANIALDNGLVLSQHQAIIWTNAGVLYIGSLRTNFREIWMKWDFIQEKKSKNAVCKIIATFSWPVWVNPEDIQYA